MFEKVVEIVKEQLNVEDVEITRETSFKDDLDADSLDLFPAEELEQITTVGAVIDYLEDKGTNNEN